VEAIQGQVSARHHFVPRFLLRAFATPTRDKGQLFVFDKATRERSPGTPKTVGCAENWNTVSAGAHPDPVVWEKSLARIESDASLVVAAMRHTRLVPTGLRERAALFALISALYAGSPRSRRRIEGSWLKRIEAHIRGHADSEAGRERWAKQQAEVAKEAIEKHPEYREAAERMLNESPEETIAQMKSGDFTIRSDTSWKVSATVKHLPQIAEVLADWNWRVLVVPTGVPDLILGDSVLACASERSGFQEVSLLTPGTMAALPLGPRHVLVGRFASAAVPAPAADADFFVGLNTLQFDWALRQVYARTADFAMHGAKGKRGIWSALRESGDLPANLTDEMGDIVDQYTARDAPAPSIAEK
jgi:hypothetical protein